MPTEVSHLKFLTLKDFRNYKSLSLEFNEKPVIFFGKNGSGKTNILEAISFLAIGNGLRGSDILEISRKEDNIDDVGHFAVNATLSNNVNLGTGLAFIANGSLRRICKIQGENVKSPSAFHDYLNIISVTPEMDLLFLDSSSARRRFIDKLIISYNPSHATNLSNYEKAARERMKILKQCSENTAWLDSIEKIIATKNLSISKARFDLTQILLEGQKKQIQIFPKFDNKFIGKLEDFLEENASIDASELENSIEKRLKNNRDVDRISGMTTFGCHRSDWSVTNLSNNRLVKSCSTGEQKIILIAVILSFIHQKIEKKGNNDDRILILLLDDSIARLDFHHRMVLFEQVVELSCLNSKYVQVFFSGTDRELFESIQTAQFFNVADSNVY